MTNLLVMSYPTWGPTESLHLNSTGSHVVFAPDYFLVCLRDLGVEIDLVSLTDERVTLPTFQSHTMPKHVSEIDYADYGAFWHMFRDPTQPEVLAKLDATGFAPGERRVFNRAEALKDLFKDRYLPVLESFGLGSRVLEGVSPRSIEWQSREHSVAVSTDGKYVCPFPYNNNRGDYRERNGREAISEYVDNINAEGLRSIFRVGYALGTCVPGYRYFSKGWIVKSGTSQSREPFEIPERFHSTIAEAMKTIGVDVCHLEGVEKDGQIYLFDINPYPTANGSTLSEITRAAARIIADSLR